MSLKVSYFCKLTRAHYTKNYFNALKVSGEQGSMGETGSSRERTVQRLPARRVLVHERGGHPHHPQDQQRQEQEHDQRLQDSGSESLKSK